MEKKTLKWYVAPEMELIDVKLQGMLCGSDNPLSDFTDETDVIESYEESLF